MSNIEKLYKLAGVNKKYCGDLDMGDLDSHYEYVMCNTLKEWNEMCSLSRNEYYQKPIITYPPFTVEKQLELIKWLVNKNEDLRLNKLPGSKHYRMGLCALSENVRYKHIGLGEFNEALAGLVISLWQDLTDELKQQVKGILE